MPTVDDLRGDVGALTTLAQADLRDLWRSVGDADAAVRELELLLPALVQTYGKAAATVAADWYDELRDEIGAPGRFRAVPAEAGDRGADVLARWGADPLFRAEPDWVTARAKIEGGLQRRVANAARDTVRGSSVRDPGARGWQRVTTGKSCGFCIMLEARGAVYSEATVDFAAHDHCDCHARPVFGDEERPVKPYTPSSRNVTAADRARTREWIAANLPDA